jgi:hypothetical protein
LSKDGFTSNTTAKTDLEKNKRLQNVGVFSSVSQDSLFEEEEEEQEEKYNQKIDHQCLLCVTFPNPFYFC